MRKINERVFEVGAIDWDRQLFDELIPLPDGTSYNAYIVKGSEKTALIDAVDPTKSDVLIDNLVKSGTDHIDYLIANHAEQDHAGGIVDVMAVFPEIIIVANEKCKNMLIDELEIDPEKFKVIEDGEQLSLGDKTLSFHFIPWVHWPETIGTYLKEDKIFFSCDFFGSHLATTSLFVEDKARVYEAAKRYYAEIMMPFRKPIQKNIETMSKLDIKIIAPSHGPLYDNPSFIVDAYKDWAGDNVKNQVIIPYVSMHGSTAKMVDYFVDACAQRGLNPQPFNLTVTDLGKLAITLVDAATIILASPTMLTVAHPTAAYGTILINTLKPKTRFMGIIGSYGWGSKMVKQIESLLDRMQVEMFEPVIAKGVPRDDDMIALENLADQIYAKHKEAGLIA